MLYHFGCFFLSFELIRWFCHWGSDYRHCYSCYVISFSLFFFHSYFHPRFIGVFDVSTSRYELGSFHFIPLTWRLIFQSLYAFFFRSFVTAPSISADSWVCVCWWWWCRQRSITVHQCAISPSSTLNFHHSPAFDVQCQTELLFHSFLTFPLRSVPFRSFSPSRLMCLLLYRSFYFNSFCILFSNIIPIHLLQLLIGRHDANVHSTIIKYHWCSNVRMGVREWVAHRL